MRLALVLLLAITAAPAVAAPREEKACVLAAAERLPRIPGLAVDKSRVRPVPVDHKGGAASMIVDIDISAAGQSDTYSYLCVMSVAGPLIRRLAN